MTEPKKVITVSIVEDDEKFRGTLARLINSTRGLVCISQHSNAESALKELPAHPPDVVMMDINMPGMSGVDCVRLLKRQLPAILVVMLTVYEDSELIFKALSAGAVGYLLKRSTPDQIIHAIQNAHQGGSPMTSQIARQVVEAFQKKQSDGQSDYGKLTTREQAVLNQLAKGSSYAQIAESLGISFYTVRAHLRSIYEKLHVNSATQAIGIHLQRAGEHPQ
jgi:DNA-binding NarL/FixJ family response regulator